MKLIQKISILLFSLLILVPLVTFNLEEESISEIDNRMLTENPFTNRNGDLSEQIESYVNDRIGLRDEMILGYTVLNDRLFGKMVHPSYSYGKDGYVFGAGVTVDTVYNEYHEAFAEMVKQIQDYCTARDVPFLFVFDPAKPAVLQEYIADGINYDRSWVDAFLQTLDELGVRYVDNTVTLTEKQQAGEMVFNQKYDANHWNDLGSLYGCNAILAELQKDFPQIHLTQAEDYTLSAELKTSLLVSQFPIHEEVPVITLHSEVENETEEYADELERSDSYPAFGYYVNEELLAEGAPRALVFQGSYMNSRGQKYLANGFGEYIFVHDYQNILNLDYYFNIFQPECVIFEVAEYTFSDGYFSYNGMLSMDLNASLESALTDCELVRSEVPSKAVVTEQGQTLTKITWNTEERYDAVWAVFGETAMDMRECEQGYEITVTLDIYPNYGEDMIFFAQSGNQMTQYRIQ
ncbi:MAG: hypothetical protein ACI3W7_01260 [Oscillospiraceae bacterium]